MAPMESRHEFLEWVVFNMSQSWSLILFEEQAMMLLHYHSQLRKMARFLNRNEELVNCDKV